MNAIFLSGMTASAAALLFALFGGVSASVGLALLIVLKQIPKVNQVFGVQKTKGASRMLLVYLGIFIAGAILTLLFLFLANIMRNGKGILE